VTVFASRFRCAYLKKRSNQSMLRFTLALLLVALAFSFAARHDEEDQLSMSTDVSPAIRASVVARWAAPSSYFFPSTPYHLERHSHQVREVRK